jgi:hypothetical protein
MTSRFLLAPAFPHFLFMSLSRFSFSEMPRPVSTNSDSKLLLCGICLFSEVSCVHIYFEFAQVLISVCHGWVERLQLTVTCLQQPMLVGVHCDCLPFTVALLAGVVQCKNHCWQLSNNNNLYSSSSNSQSFFKDKRVFPAFSMVFYFFPISRVFVC